MLPWPQMPRARAAVAALARPADERARERLAWLLPRLIVAVGGAFLLVFLLREADRNVSDAYAVISWEYETTWVPLLNNNDFPMLYTGAETALSSERGDLYDMRSMVRKIQATRGYNPAYEPPPDFSPKESRYEWQRYYNPPLFLAALSPLTLLDLKSAYLVAVGINLALIGVLAVVVGFVLRWRQPQTLLLQLALIGFTPAATAVHHAQPTVLIAILLACGYLAVRAGRPLLGGVLLAMTGVKPHWLVMSLPALWAEKRLTAPFFAACAGLLALPFVLLLGFGSVIDYFDLVTARGNGDLYDADYASALLSWTGFLRAYTGEPQPVLWLIASAATLGAVAIVAWRGEIETAIGAGVFGALLVVPHSQAQDWIIVIPAAAVLLSRGWGPVALTGIVCGLFAVFIGGNDWQQAQKLMDANGQATYWVTLAGFGLLFWLAVVSLFEERLEGSFKALTRRIEKTPA